MLGVWKLTSLKREIEKGREIKVFFTMIERDECYQMQE